MKCAIASLFALVAVAATAAPPEEMPAEMPAEQPAAAPQPSGTPAGTPAPDAGEVIKSRGATIIGDDETPLGLYIMPWRSSTAASGLDRPARLLDDSLVPLDPDVFRRQVAYNQALADQLRRTQRVTPERK